MTFTGPRPLRAGPLSLVLHDGDLRYVRCGDVEIVRRLHGAVRDASWDTIAGELTDVSVDEHGGGFSLRYTSRHRAGEIDFDWRATVEATDGTLTFTFDGEARAAFLKNRIGLCALLPPRAWADRHVEVATASGDAAVVQIPALVAREQPVAGLHGLGTLATELVPGLHVRLSFEGEPFEIEDQRNWIDASFKAYGTPLAWPRPVRIGAGTRVWQRVTLHVDDRRSPGSRSGPRPVEAPPARLQATAAAPRPVPRVGIGLGRLESDDAVTRTRVLLDALAPDHVRLVVGPTPALARTTLRTWADACAARVAPAAVEIVLEVPDDRADARALVHAVVASWPRGVSCARVLAQAERVPTTTAGALRVACDLVAAAGWPDVPVVTGSRADLYELHLFPPPSGDGLGWGMNPQVHAFDHASIGETPPAAAAQVHAMRLRHPDTRLVVSPITLERRGRPSPALRHDALAGAWTAAMLAHLLPSAADALTFGDHLDHFCGHEGTLTPMARVLGAFATQRDVRAARTPGEPSSGGNDPGSVAPRLLVTALDAADPWVVGLQFDGSRPCHWIVNPDPHRLRRIDVTAVLDPAIPHTAMIDVGACGIVRLEAGAPVPW